MEESFFLQMLDDIEKKKLIIEPIDEIEQGHAGNVKYKVSNGWQLIVFIDCGQFDYIDSFLAPNGEIIDAFERNDFELLRNYYPSIAAQKSFYKIPYVQW